MLNLFTLLTKLPLLTSPLRYISMFHTNNIQQEKHNYGNYGFKQFNSTHNRFSLSLYRARQRRLPRERLVYSAAQELEALLETPLKLKGPPNAYTSQTSPSGFETLTSGRCLGYGAWECCWIVSSKNKENQIN